MRAFTVRRFAAFELRRFSTLCALPVWRTHSDEIYIRLAHRFFLGHRSRPQWVPCSALEMPSPGQFGFSPFNGWSQSRSAHYPASPVSGAPLSCLSGQLEHCSLAFSPSSCSFIMALASNMTASSHTSANQETVSQCSLGHSDTLPTSPLIRT